LLPVVESRAEALQMWLFQFPDISFRGIIVPHENFSDLNEAICFPMEDTIKIYISPEFEVYFKKNRSTRGPMKA
jgi:hypothetical protein